MDQNEKDFQTKDEMSKKPKTPFGLQVFLGFIAYWCTVFFGANIFGAGVSFVILLVSTIFLHEGYRWKGFTLGVLLGLGVTALVFGLVWGLCFAMSR